MGSNLEIGDRATVITSGDDVILTLDGFRILGAGAGREFLCRWTIGGNAHERWVSDCWLRKVSIEDAA